MDKAKYYDYMLSVLDKAENGPVIEEKEWDRQYINKEIKRLIKKYDVQWDAETMVPDDNALADRVFEAGMELATNTGIYCIDTKRQMKWTQDELQMVIDSTPIEEVLGSGEGKVIIKPRRPDDDSPIVCVGGPYGTQVPEELYVPIMQSYAQEKIIDWIDDASLISTHGRPIRAGSPWEAVACWQEAQMSKEAIRRAGRPDMPIGAAENSPSAIGELSSCTEGGFRLTDWHHACLVSELKVPYAELTKAMHYIHTGASYHNFYNTIFGGYVGGGDGMAVAIVAGLVLMKACLGGMTLNPGPSHAHLSCNTFPAMLPSQAIGHQGVTRNTNLFTSAFTRPVGGPGTKDILYESAAFAVSSVVSGISVMEGTQAATGRFTAHVSGLEARFNAEVAHAAVGMSRREANEIVQKIVPLYADQQHLMNKGKPFNEVYDVETVQPTAEWRGIYEEVCSELKNLVGLNL
jgi:methylamine---corrinoid protein Co-methyltransferase